MVWRKARQLADEVRLAVELWPLRDRRTAADQVIRCADSVPANIAEAMGRDTRPQQCHFLVVARGSAYELENWLDSCESRGLERPQNGPERAREISRMLNGLIRRRR